MISEEMRTEIIDGLMQILANKVYSIILYGSSARGDHKPDSDIDIAVVLYSNMENGEKSEFLHWNAELDLKYGKVFSIVDINKSQIDQWGKVLPFYKNIQNEGVILWKAA